MTLVIINAAGIPVAQATEDERIDAIMAICNQEVEQLEAFFNEASELAEKLYEERNCPMISEWEVAEEAFDEMVKKYGYTTKEME